MSGAPNSTPSTPSPQSSAPASAPATDTSTPASTPSTPVESPEDRYASEMRDFEDAVRFDPFADGAKPAGAGGTASPSGAPRPTQGADSTAQPASTAQPGNPPAPTQQSTQQAPDPIAALQQAAQQISGAADRLQAPQQQVTPQAPTDDTPAFLFDVPPQLTEALYSSDPAQRAAGVQYLVAGTARAAFKEAKRLVDDFSKAVPNIVAQHIQAHTYRENVRRDFYGKYPQLDNPHLAPTVASVSQAVMQTLARSGQRPTWSPQIADLIATEVFKLIPGLAKPGQPVVPPAQPTVPLNGQTPPAIFTNGSRPAMPDNGANSQGAMEDLILLGRQ